MNLIVEVNPIAINDTSRPYINLGIIVSPPVDEKFWLMRVPISETQAMVALPKFKNIHIGFQNEIVWNTNVPWCTNAIEILRWIDQNKIDPKISRGDCLESIVMLQGRIIEIFRSDTADKLRSKPDDQTKLIILEKFLMDTGSWKIALEIPTRK